jgi:Transglutaminase-like superfamily
VCEDPVHRAKISWMWNTARKLLRLPWALKRFVLRSVLILPMTYAGLGLFGFKRLLGGIEHLAPVGGRVADFYPEEIRTYVHLFSAVARRCPLPMQCLGRSVALWWLLRLQGIDGKVHIGVRKEHDCLDGHAWVQFGDLVINDMEDVGEHYTRVIPTYSGIDIIR